MCGGSGRVIVGNTTTERKKAERRRAEQQRARARKASFAWGRKPKPKAKKGACFIATAVYGSYDAPEVVLLRAYRDRFLMRHAFGRALVRVYYFASPPLAGLLQESKLLRTVIKTLFLNPALAFVRRNYREKGPGSITIRSNE
jgi:hypothetical protein